jgi:hypothetical protein
MEPVPPGNLEGHQADLPRALRHRERALDPADLKHVHRRGAERHRPADRDGVDEAAVEIVLATDVDGRQQAGYRARREYGRYQRPGAEPAGAGALDARGHALERQLKVGEVAGGQHLLEHLTERLDRVQVGAGPGQPDCTPDQVLAERLPHGLAPPQLAEPLRGSGRIGGHERAVDRADRGSHDQVGLDPGLGQRPQHADLVGAEQAPATEHERGRHRRSAG